MREERDKIKSEFNQLKEELAARDKSINNLQKQLEEKETAIATLKSELEVRGDIQLNLFPPESTPTPEPESNPTPETETENTESPAVNPQPSTVNPETEEPEPNTTEGLQTEIVDSKGLLAYIDKKSPNSGINYEKIRDAIRDKDKKAEGSEFSRLFLLEQAYGFTFLGKINNRYQFKIPKL